MTFQLQEGGKRVVHMWLVSKASSSSIMGNCAAASKASILQKGGCAHGLKTTGICQKLCKHFCGQEKKVKRNICFFF